MKSKIALFALSVYACVFIILGPLLLAEYMSNEIFLMLYAPHFLFVCWAIDWYNKSDVEKEIEKW